jgi:cytochrome c biogenesis protein CcmG/thiol:disulfide interchange protein DsbE
MRESVQIAIIMLGLTMSKNNLAKLLVLAVIVAASLFFALRQRPPHPVAIGEAAPDFTLRTLTSTPISLRDFRRQVVVLNFWATWCAPCVEEAPGLERFAQQMRDQGVTVLGVSVDQDAEALQKFVAETRLSFRIARDPDQAVASRYGTFKFPETYILDRDGKVAEKFIGAVDWQDPRVVGFVQELARGLTGQGQ